MITGPEALHPETGHYNDRGDVGYKHTLSDIQIQLIVIGGAVGVACSSAQTQG
jgi:hypothetical protein